jgi:hypothetical protein
MLTTTYSSGLHAMAKQQSRPSEYDTETSASPSSRLANKKFRFSDTCHLPLTSEYMISYRPAHPLVKIIMELKEKSTICKYCFKNNRYKSEIISDYVYEFCSSLCMYYFDVSASMDISIEDDHNDLENIVDTSQKNKYKNVHFSYLKRIDANAHKRV